MYERQYFLYNRKEDVVVRNKKEDTAMPGAENCSSGKRQKEVSI